VLAVIDDLKSKGRIDDPMADLLRAKVYDSQGQRRICEHFCERAYEKWPQPVEDWDGYLTAACSLSALRMLRNDTEGALAVALDALDKEADGNANQPLHRSALLHTVSQSLHALKRPECIRSELESLRLLREHPEDGNYKYNSIISYRALFELYFDHDDFENAQSWLTQWKQEIEAGTLKEDPEFEREYRAAMELGRARLLQKTGNPREAARLFATIPPEDLEFPFTVDDAAEYLMAAGRYGEAADWLARLDEKDYQDDGARMNLDNINSRLAPRYIASMKAGRTQSALALGARICEALDSAVTWERNDRTAELAIVYDISQKEDAMHTKQAQVAILRNIIFCLILFLIVVGVALRVVMVSQHQLREKNQDLYETVQLLTAREEAAIETLQKEPEEGLNPRQKLFRRICTLMQDDKPYTDSKLKREDLAKMLATNYNNVAEAIKECSNGQTLSEFLDGFRLKHAARMLAKLDEPIGLISEMSGFQSRAHFNALFREKYKMTPSEYRNVIQETKSV
jgi:AraC-like DNA-binding protein